MRRRTFRFTVETFLKVAAIAMLSLYFFARCQQEVEEVLVPPNGEVITSDSTVAQLMQFAALRDGSGDNIVDGSSCTSLALPITVVVNGLEVILDSEEDFLTVERIIDKFDNDNDIIEIAFPITVILADHSEVQLDSKEALDELIGECTENVEDDDIECVDFVFPMSVSLYDADNQISDVLTINSDKELYTLLNELKETDYAQINFPVSVVLADGQQMVVDSNKELEDILLSAKNECDEDDDTDHNDDDIDDSAFVEVLLDGNWVVTKMTKDSDHTEAFAGYTFSFYEQGWAKALHGDLYTEGEWDSNGNSGELELELHFGAETPFSLIKGYWTVLEFDEKAIILKSYTDNGDIFYLTFERPKDTGEVPQEIINMLIDGSWVVANYTIANDPVTDAFEGFELYFFEDQKVKAIKVNDIFEGYWDALKNNEGESKLLMEFENITPLNWLTNDWWIVEVTEGRIELKDINGIDGTVTILVLERPSEEPPLLSEVIQHGSWIVANYNDSDKDSTSVYNDIVFNFLDEQVVKATKGNDTVTGTWRIGVNNDGEFMYLDFGDNAPLSKFNNEWPVIDVREDRFELKEYNDDQSIDKLVFEKLL